MSIVSSQPMRPAAKSAAMFALGAVYAGLAIAAWLWLVPDMISTPTFGWIALLAVATTIAAAWSIAGARSTRSIAHVLYDVEHPARLPKI